MATPTATPKKSGWLQHTFCKGEATPTTNWKGWEKRWFSIVGDKLLFFKKETDKSPKGEICINSIRSVTPATDDVAKMKKSAVVHVVTTTTTHLLSAETQEERDSWISTLFGTACPSGVKKVGVNDFELVKLIGIGSFGKVMQVRMRETGEIFAMKMLSKQHIVQHNEVEHTLAEKHILQTIRHPFLVGLHYSFQTEDKLYFILDFVNGGELFNHLQREKFTLERSRFYAAEICLALEHLHRNGVIYRDLKPENLLLTYEGHIVMTDFGLCKLGTSASTFCGTPEYLAPEVLMGNGYGNPVDWWSYGSLVYEMLTGLPPYYSTDVQEMYRKIMADVLTFPPYLEADARDLISRLLERNPAKRLSDPAVIKKHQFFAGLDWEALYHKGIPPPFIPQVKNQEDTAQIDEKFLAEAPSHDLAGHPAGPLTAQDQKDFAGFTYVAPEPQADAPKP